MANQSLPAPPSTPPDYIELDELFRRLRRSLPLIAGLTVVGLASGVGFALFLRAHQAPVSAILVELPGLRGTSVALYPDDTPFQPDNLRAPAAVQEAARRAGLSENTGIAGRLEVAGVIPAGVARERDRARAAGQAVPGFVPTEYRITLHPDPADNSALAAAQARRLLTELAAASAGTYNQTRARLPLELGHAFATLKDLDYSEYNEVITEDIKALDTQLETRAAKTGSNARRELKFFLNLHVPYAMSQLWASGASKNPPVALTQAMIYLSSLNESEQGLLLEDQALTEIMERYQTPAAGGAKAGSESLAVRALETRLLLKRRASDKVRLLAQIEQLKNRASVPAALGELESSYNTLIEHIQQAIARQAAIDNATTFRVTQPAFTEAPAPRLAYAGFIGLGLGLMLGIGLGLARSARRNAAS